MLNTYLTLSLRNLLRERIYAVINILGLSLGVACFLIIGLYLHMELTFDRFNADHERIYRLTETYANSARNDSINTGGALAATLQSEFPEIENTVRFREYSYSASEFLFRYQDREFFEQDLLFADPSVFDIFTFDIREGDPRTALTEPGTIALSASMAQRYFGEASALNKILSTDLMEYRVTLVFEDLPQNTHLPYDALVSLSTMSRINPRELEALGANQYYTYLQLRAGASAEAFNRQSPAFVEKYAARLGPAEGLSYYLEPLANIHLGSGVNQGGRPVGNRFIVFIFSLTGFFVLTIAGINYINLATARSIRRAKEVGVRKVLGAGRRELVAQFLGESFFYTGVAFIVGMCLAELILTTSTLEQMLGYELSLASVNDPLWIAGGVATLLLLGLVAGLYPAFYLANLLPVTTLRKQSTAPGRGALMRQMLVVLQFVISIAIIASTFLMYAQLNYVNSYSLGFDKDNKLLVRLYGADAIGRAHQRLNQLTSPSVIRGASIIDSGSVPGSRVGEGWPTGAPGDNEANAPLVDRIYVDSSFFDTLGIELLQGRTFNELIVTDQTDAVIVNTALLEEMGWTDPVGSRVWLGNPRQGGKTIVGVVNDFHTMGLQQQVQPLLISMANTDYSGLSDTQRAEQIQTLMLAIEPGAEADAIRALQAQWREIDLVHPFEFQWLDDNLNAMYLSEGRQMQLIGVFSAICIFISCLGLLGLASFTTQQRTKEIGIRRVLGATIGNIVLLLFKNTFYLMLIASVIATLLSYTAITQWLEGFYYRIDINPLMFVQATVIALVTAFTTMATQSWKVANQNPIDALRHD